MIDTVMPRTALPEAVESVPLPPPEDRGSLIIRDAAVAKIARTAAAEVSPIHRVTGVDRLVSSDLPRAEVTVTAGQVDAALTVAAKWPTPVSAVAQRVQEAVSVQIREHTGLTVTRVDVDVHYVSSDERPGGRRVQ